MSTECNLYPLTNFFSGCFAESGRLFLSYTDLSFLIVKLGFFIAYSSFKVKCLGNAWLFSTEIPARSSALRDLLQWYWGPTYTGLNSSNVLVARI